MATAPEVPKGQQLNKKDDALFKSVSKYYESKQMKKALKTVNQVLKNNPEHGESMAMKGLILSATGNNREEAYDLVKQGLFKNLKSLICWHVYGLLYRADKNYVEAIKCYKQALNIEDSNLPILRDTAMLQIHIRDLKSLADTRQTLLQKKNGQTRANWLGFAFAHHLQCNYECTLAILDAYEGTMGLVEAKYDLSEYLLYKILVILESKDYERVLTEIAKHKEKLLDQEFVQSALAAAHAGLGNTKEEVECRHNLVEQNSENLEFVNRLVKAMGGKLLEDERTDEDIKKTNEIVAELRKEFPRSQVLQKLECDVSVGDTLKAKLEELLKKYIIKNIPSIGSLLKSFHKDPPKREVLQNMLLGIEKEINEKNTVLGEPANKLCIVSAWNAIANHYLMLGEYETALSYCRKAIEHTPTMEALYALKFNIMKKMPDEESQREATASIDTARKLDLADRYHNTITVKRYFKVGDWEEAEKVMSAFTYKSPNETWTTVLEMQAMWYEIAMGDCLYKHGDVINALSKYLLVDRHYEDIQEDQFDFHHYVGRKHNMRAYLEMLRFADDCKNHKFYCNSASRVVRCYLDLHQLGEEECKKRLLQPFEEKEKIRKASLNKDHSEREKDLAVTINYENPLKAALPFLQTILKYRGTHIETQLLAIEYYSAAQQPLGTLRAIKQALSLPESSKSVPLKEAATKFFDTMAKTELSAVVGKIVSEQKELILKQFS
eukprot:TRINITY_DN714_c9_g1_i1.p1 TRINITY_DN714_c9_g1~~TRINITY_DN714_c9_g1_i1.p1  ORF type:complete len:723 (+),score=187.56 TRINITY_DN714_c9_g1_i1:34-2202(+)